MYYLLFIFYFILACFFIVRNPFLKNSQLPNKTLLGLFLIKILAGVAFGYIIQRFYPQGADAIGLNNYGKEEYINLVRRPAVFFTDIFTLNQQNGTGSIISWLSITWTNLHYNLLIKILAVCNLLSGGNYYINSLFFNFFCFFGHIALYRIYIDIYPGGKWAILAGLFLLPSTIFFSSGLGKDIVVFTMLGILLYAIYFSLKRGINFKRMIGIIVAIFFLLSIRNYVVVALSAAAIAWIISVKYRKNVVSTFIAVYLIAGSAIGLLQFAKPAFSPLKIITERQQDFLSLPTASSQLQMDTLIPTVKSFITNAPQAINHSLLRPYIGEFDNAFYTLLSIEVIIYVIILLLALVFYRKTTTVNPYLLFTLLFCVSIFLFIGYIVPNVGSIARYRSIYLPLAIIPLLCSINFKRIKVY